MFYVVETIEELIQNKTNNATTNNEELRDYLCEINFTEVVKKYVRKIKEGNETEKLEKINIKVFHHSEDFLKAISYNTTVLVPIGGNQKLGGKEGNTRILEGYSGINRFGTASRIIDYEENFSYEYVDYKNGWYGGEKYTFKALDINKDVKNERFFIVTVGQRKVISNWELYRIDCLTINIYVTNI